MESVMDTKLTLTDRLERVERLAAEEPDSNSLRDELRSLRDDVVRYETERHGLHQEMAARDTEARRLTETVAQARRRNADVASLYVATHRLHSTLDRGHVLQAIEEIVASLLGCEEMAIFEIVGDPPVLAPVSTAGLRPGSIGTIKLGDGVLGRVTETGQMWIGDAAEHELAGRPVTACVPLKVDGEVTGALVLFRLLDHKGTLDSQDLELLDVISVHAGTALYATRLRQREAGKRP